MGSVYIGNRVVDLAVSAQLSLRQDPEGVGDLLLRSTSGISVPLKSVANVYLSDDRAAIDHDGGFRSRVVALDPRDPGGFVGKARNAVTKLDLPAGAFVQIESDYAADSAARNDLLSNYVFALLAVFAVLAVAFDAGTAALILISSLFALIGAAAAIVLMGGTLSIGALVGLVALLGPSLRGAILLFGQLEDLVLTRHAPWSLAAVVAATREQSMPIVITALLIALALTPFAIHAGAAGQELLGPMAVVIIAGMITSALGTLFVLPSLVFAFRCAASRRPAYHAGLGARLLDLRLEHRIALDPANKYGLRKQQPDSRRIAGKGAPRVFAAVSPDVDRPEDKPRHPQQYADPTQHGNHRLAEPGAITQPKVFGEVASHRRHGDHQQERQSEEHARK